MNRLAAGGAAVTQTRSSVGNRGLIPRLTLDRVIAFAAFAAVVVMAVRVPVDTDMYWHLRTGQYIVQTGSIPTTDPFSWTAAGAVWVNVHWLSQVILYASYSAGGWPLVGLATAAVALGAIVLVWRQLEGPVFLKAGTLVLTAVTAGAVWTARSQMATFVLTAVVASVLHARKWRGRDRLWLLPPVFLVWANLHGGFIAGFLLLGAFLLGEALGLLSKDRLRTEEPGSRRLERKDWLRLGMVVLVSVLLLVVNPHGARVLALPFETVTNPSLQAFVHEWASPDFHELFLQPMVWMLLLTLVAVGRSGRRLDPTDAVTLTGFAYIAFLAQRNIGLFAIVCAPILARHASSWWAGTRLADRRLSDGLPALNWAVAALVATLVVLRVGATLSPANHTAAEESTLPVRAIDWIEDHRPPGPIFNSYNWGGYLLWRLWPDYSTYVDGRTDLYSATQLDQYRAVTFASDFDAVLDRRGINLLLIDNGGVLDGALERDSDHPASRWQVAYRDNQAVVWVRQ